MAGAGVGLVSAFVSRGLLTVIEIKHSVSRFVISIFDEGTL